MLFCPYGVHINKFYCSIPAHGKYTRRTIANLLKFSKENKKLFPSSRWNFERFNVRNGGEIGQKMSSE